MDGTTEVAALVVLAAGVLAGIGALALASAVIAVTCLLLVEKSRLHGLVGRVDDVELRAGARFAVMAVVILPLLPEGPLGPWGGVRPRQLWTLVLLFAGLSFAGFLARRVVGPKRGYVVAGLLGGLISSTSVTLGFARTSRHEDGNGPALAQGVLAACVVMYARALVTTALLRPALASGVLLYLVPPAAVGAALVLGRRPPESSRHAARGGPANPLQFWSALQMAALFQAVLFAVHAARGVWGDASLIGAGALLGVTDVDALTLAMSASVGEGAPVALAARALAVGALANTLLKLALAVVIGRGRFRAQAGGYLSVLSLAAAAMLVAL